MKKELVGGFNGNSFNRINAGRMQLRFIRNNKKQRKQRIQKLQRRQQRKQRRQPVIQDTILQWCFRIHYRFCTDKWFAYSAGSPVGSG